MTHESQERPVERLRPLYAAVEKLYEELGKLDEEMTPPPVPPLDVKTRSGRPLSPPDLAALPIDDDGGVRDLVVGGCTIGQLIDHALWAAEAVEVFEAHHKANLKEMVGYLSQRDAAWAQLRALGVEPEGTA